MRPFRGVLQWAIALAACVCATVAPAQAVRVDVDARDTVASGAPRAFGFSGNIWRVQEVFNAGIGDRIVAMPRLGITRVSLGDSIIEPAADLAGLKRRLEEFPMNDFLRRYKAAGGRVLLILDGTPRWLSSSSDTRIVKGPDQPRFRMSPPVDYKGWSEVVEAVVRHFNGKLGLDAYYEAWNEPNYYYYGSADQFMRQYYHSVLGARRADPKALIGGPGISEIIGAGTALLPASGEEKERLATLALQEQFLFRQFLDRAAHTSVPELGLARLPVDFFSWHVYYFDPARYYGVVVPYVREALAQAGYPRSTPMIVSEWNIAAVPPYPEGDLNANHVDAAYVAASLIAMNEAGVDGQAFQMYVDPGGEGYYGGMFTIGGVPRANFHAFSLFSRLRGRQVRVTSSDPWVKATAFVDGDTTYVLVASYVPTRQMLMQTQGVADFLENRDFARSLVSGKLVGAMLSGRLPQPEARHAREIEEATRKRIQAGLEQAKRRTREVIIDISVAGLRGTPRSATRYLIDSRHANAHADLATVNRKLESASAPQGGKEAHFERALDAAGLERGTSREVMGALRSGQPLDRALSGLPVAKRQGVARALEGARDELLSRHREALAQVEKMDSVRLDATRMDWPASGPLRVTVEPYSVQLFVLGP